MKLETEAEEPPKSPFLRRVFLVEDGIINAVLLTMAVLPAISIPLRIAGVGFAGGQAIVQHLTLWAAFLGALLTTRQGKHLSLSTSELMPEGPWRARAKVFTYTVSAGVCGLLVAAAIKLVLADAESNEEIIGGIPVWVSEAVMPVAFAGMGLRFIWNASPSWAGRGAALAGVAIAFSFALLENDPTIILWPVAILIVAALLLGAPIFIAMSGLALLFFFTHDGVIATVPGEALRLAMSPNFPGIPLLTIAGFILGEGGAAKRLVRLCRAWMGWMPGGAAIMVCLVCALFTAFTGGSGVTILALGGLMLPILLEEKYPEGFSLGLVTASGSLGLLFPPSLPVILYSVVAEIPNMNDLYIAGLVPGALMILLVCAYAMFVGVRSNTPRHPFVVAEAKAALWEAKWELALPVVMGVVILGGFATIVEAAAVAAVYAIIVEVFVFKDISLRDLPKSIVRGASLVGSVMIVLGAALGLTFYLVDAQIFDLIVDWMKTNITSGWVLLLVLNALLLVVGSVVEIYAAIVILAPLIARLADVESYQLDKIHLAIVFLANLELGFLFPPVGLNLFLSSSRFEKPLPQLYRNAFPFLCIMTIAVLLITYVKATTIGVLALFGGAHGGG